MYIFSVHNMPLTLLDVFDFDLAFDLGFAFKHRSKLLNLLIKKMSLFNAKPLLIF